MGRRKESIVFLDTHILVWLYAGLPEKLTEIAKLSVERSELFASQFSRLELQYLYEIGRIKTVPSIILKNLEKSINLHMSNIALDKIIDAALQINWTRDVFDRLLISEVLLTKSMLITADQEIRAHVNQVIW
jgi:PIN domain nuclease of toxin-antitoxin system